MSIQSDFYALLDPVFGGQLYRNFAPSPAAAYGVYFRVTGVEESTLDANGGTGNPTNTRLQLDIYGPTGAQVDALAAGVKAALKGWAVENVLLLELDGYEPDTKLHRITLDISTWHL
ncbi:tail completion protein gp17 [Massilia sp. DWR3-1-1]|uniref:tail completion protein gp17 n=1 Tax=Massilia sp. DWR3-1-1 TaxID=2804559 RepID=UPI003CE98D3D